ncbi:hypothetical protein ACN24M_20275 [Streptomyces microflavus]|uniref:hypothetical protein n=1 Tax=Streptomyces microflavus TaxID=1919 RepID=UPI003B22673B
MTDKTETVSAPIPVSVRRIPGGSRLILDRFARAVVEDVLDALLSTDRDSDLYERLVALAQMEPAERAAMPEHRLPYEELAEDLADVASKWTPMYGERGLQLAEALTSNAARAASGRWSEEALKVWQRLRREAEMAAPGLAGGAAA